MDWRNFEDLSIECAQDVCVRRGKGLSKILRMQEKLEGSPSLIPGMPMALAREGATLEDADGNVYIDCYSGRESWRWATLTMSRGRPRAAR